MSDEKEPAETKPAETKSIEVPEAVIEAKAAEAARQHLEKMTPGLTAQLSSAVKSAVQERNLEIAKALGVAPEVNPDKQILDSFQNDPSGFLAKFGSVIKQSIEEEALQGQIAKEEAQTAAQEVFSDRPDVVNDQKAKQLVADFYQAQDPRLSTKEKMQRALKRYDNLMEELGHGNVQARLAKAQSPSSGGKSKGAPSSEAPTSYAEREQAARDRYLAAVKERQQRIRGNI